MQIFNLKGKNAVILGGGGVLGTAMTFALAEAGANVAVCSLHEESARAAANTVAEAINSGKTQNRYETSAEAGAETAYRKIQSYKLNTLDLEELKCVCNRITGDFGSVDILVNAVGGNMKDATTSDTQSFFDLSREAIEKVVGLNLMGGAALPCQVFGKVMAESEKGGVIINITSMNAFRPLTRIPGYSAAKAAVSNFTQWLSTHFAKEYGEKIRVNAIAPGFFLTEQNRFLLTDAETGGLTARGKSIIDHTPMGRFGSPEDLAGTLVWLASDASRFITGIVVPVDGGFSAFSGV